MRRSLVMAFFARGVRAYIPMHPFVIFHTQLIIQRTLQQIVYEGDLPSSSPLVKGGPGGINSATRRPFMSNISICRGEVTSPETVIVTDELNGFG